MGRQSQGEIDPAIQNPIDQTGESAESDPGMNTPKPLRIASVAADWESASETTIRSDGR